MGHIVKFMKMAKKTGFPKVEWEKETASLAKILTSELILLKLNSFDIFR